MFQTRVLAALSWMCVWEKRWCSRRYVGLHHTQCGCHTEREKGRHEWITLLATLCLENIVGVAEDGIGIGRVAKGR